MSAPTYYLDYGDKYLNKFLSNTRKTLSNDGKKWVDNALLNLQYEMDMGIQDNPSIELDNELFTDFAFDTHVKAYEDAGILHLSVLDKVKIMLTVEPKDLLSTRGVKQAVAVANDQALLYQNNIPFAINQATEAARNGREIYNLVLK